MKAIARELFHIRSADTPDGMPAVPYIVFLVRPDGIGAYYLARTSLEPLGIAFGYELLDQKLAVNIPDYDDVRTWDGTMPLDMPLEAAPGSSSSPKRMARGDSDRGPSSDQIAGRTRGDQGSMIGSIADAGARSRQPSDGRSSTPDSGPDEFVWPGRTRSAAKGGERESNPIATTERGSPEPAGSHGFPHAERSAGGNSLVGSAGAPDPLPSQELARAAEPGSPGANGDPGADSSGENRNVGQFAVGADGGQGSRNQPVGLGSGMTGKTVNAEDLAGAGEAGRTEFGAGAGRAGAGGGVGGTGAREKGDPADRPFVSGGPGTGGLTARQPMPDAARLRGTDDGAPLPEFEPIADQAGSGAVSSGLAGRTSAAGSAGVQQQRGPASFSGPAGDQAPKSGSNQTGEKSTTSTKPDRTGDQGQAGGFDWKQAAQERPNSGDTDALASDPGQGGQFAGDQAAVQGTTPSAEDLAPGRAISRADLEALGRSGALKGVDSSGTYSQEDVDRAKALSGLSSLVSPGLAEKLVRAATSSGSIPGTPSNNSSSNSSNDHSPPNSQPSGMPLGGNTQSSPSSSASSSGSIGQFGIPNSSATSDEAQEIRVSPRKKDYATPEAIDARFEIVVVCRRNEVMLHPGAYRLTGDVLRSRSDGPDSILAREIRAMVRNRAIVDPLIRQKPAIRFLVESQGAETFAIARRQLLFSLPDWPVSLQVVGSQDSGILSRNPW